ncbi:MAG: DNA polymerase III subunit beta [Rhodospirillaceae bacterium]
MHFTIERADLLKTLAHVQSVVERKNTIPILQNVCLNADKGRLLITGTDMDMEIVEAAPCAVTLAGLTTVSAHTLYDIVRKLPEGAQVDIKAVDGGQIAITCGRSRFKLACLPAADFPSFMGGDFTHNFSMPAATLRRLIDRSRFAISTEETRYYLNGIYLHIAKGTDGPMLRAVATDGHRLARVDCIAPEGAPGMPGIIVPRKTVIELRKLLDDAGESLVTVHLNDSKIRVDLGELVLTSKLIDGTYPDYERVVPMSNDKTLEVERGALAAATDRVSAISNERSRALKLECAGPLITLTATSAEAGTAVEEVEAKLAGDAITIGFNAKYLVEILDQVTGDIARFALTDGGGPALITDPTDEHALFVLMPMRV